MRITHRSRRIAGFAVCGLMAASAFLSRDQERETSARSPSWPATRGPSRLAPAPRRPGPQAAVDRFGYLPTIEPVGDAAAAGATPTLAVADPDGRRPRLIRLTPAGPATVEELPPAMEASLERVRRLLTLAYLVESGAESPDGKQVDSFAWREFWSRRLDRFPAWAAEPPTEGGRRRAPVREVLTALAQVRMTFRGWPRLRAYVRGFGRETTSVRHFGLALTALPGTPRAASEPARAPASLGAASAERERIPAFVGWLRDDQPAVFTGAVAERDLARRWVSSLEQSSGSSVPPALPGGRGCVDVVYAPEAGIKSVRDVKSGRPVGGGPLKGIYQARLSDGRAREFVSRGEVEFRESERGPVLRARLPFEEYVARVVDRAGASVSWEAAKAVAVLARAEAAGWPVNREGCRMTVASGEALPFSLSPASSSSRRAAAWTAELTASVAGAARAQAFASGAAGLGSDAVRLADSGKFYDEIVSEVASGAKLAPFASSAVAAAASQASRERLN